MDEFLHTTLKEDDDPPSDQGNRTLGQFGSLLDFQHPWDSPPGSPGVNSDAIIAWILYLVGSAFLASGDNGSVREILELLQPVNGNLAALLSSKMNHGFIQDKT